ncbi:hypothetical protein KIPB_008986 [Kipferlia bialata]|uniref:Uncharacterized protein n=1 Tax=Kipferlia bialata TaxID=797122 RepID=A0A391NVQ7_9EUKA|nr:hypothetical protein KIPB_008986 [Kipferlia bialata]|eukprot:g8986.t1
MGWKNDEIWYMRGFLTGQHKRISLRTPVPVSTRVQPKSLSRIVELPYLTLDTPRWCGVDAVSGWSMTRNDEIRLTTGFSYWTTYEDSYLYPRACQD